MSSVASLESTALALLAGWPLAAGIVLVIWSRARAAEHARREAALESELQALYRDVEGRPVPERLAVVIEALEEAEAMAATPPPPAPPRLRRRAPVAAA